MTTGGGVGPLLGIIPFAVLRSGVIASLVETDSPGGGVLALVCSTFASAVDAVTAAVPAALVGTVSAAEVAAVKTAVRSLRLDAHLPAFARDMLARALSSPVRSHRYWGRLLDLVGEFGRDEEDASEFVDNYSQLFILSLQARAVAEGIEWDLERRDFSHWPVDSDGLDAFLSAAIRAYVRDLPRCI